MCVCVCVCVCWGGGGVGVCINSGTLVSTCTEIFCSLSQTKTTSSMKFTLLIGTHHSCHISI